MSIEGFWKLYTSYADQDPCREIVEALLKYEGEGPSHSQIEERIGFLRDKLIIEDLDREFWALSEEYALRVVHDKAPEMFCDLWERKLGRYYKKIEEIRKAFFKRAEMEEEGVTVSHFPETFHMLNDGTGTVIQQKLLVSLGNGRSVLAYPCEAKRETRGEVRFVDREIVYKQKRFDEDGGFGVLLDYNAFRNFRKQLTKEERSYFFAPLSFFQEKARMHQQVDHEKLDYEKYPCRAYQWFLTDNLGVTQVEQEEIVFELFRKQSRLFECDLIPMGKKQFLYRRSKAGVKAFMRQQMLVPTSEIGINLHKAWNEWTPWTCYSKLQDELDPRRVKEHYKQIADFDLACQLYGYFTGEVPFKSGIPAREDLCTLENVHRTVFEIELQRVGCPYKIRELLLNALFYKPLELGTLPDKVTLMPPLEITGVYVERAQELRVFSNEKLRPQITRDLLTAVLIVLKKGFILFDMNPRNILCRFEGEDFKLALNDFEGLIDFKQFKSEGNHQFLQTILKAMKGWNLCFATDLLIEEEHKAILKYIEKLLMKAPLKKLQLEVLHKKLIRFQILMLGNILFNHGTSESTLVAKMIEKNHKKRASLEDIEQFLKSDEVPC